MIKKAFIAVFFLLISAGTGFAQVGITSVPFLQIEPDSRAAGMGNTGVAIADNASAIFWNPAGLGFQRGSQISITHSEWLPQFNADLFYDYLVGKYHLDGVGTVGAHITFLNLGEQVRTNAQGNRINKFNSYELAAGVSYGVQLNRNFSLGTGIRFIYSSLADGGQNGQQDINPGSSVGVDLSGMYKSDTFSVLDRDAHINAGLNISNLGPKMQYTDDGQKDPLPTMLRVGWAFTTDLDEDGVNTLTIANDISKIMARADTSGNTTGSLKALFTSWDSIQRKTGSGPTTLSLGEQLMVATGLEYWYNDLFALRSGFYYEDPNNGDRQYITLGAGLRYKFFGVDFSYINTLGDKSHPLSNTTRFGLVLNF